MGVPAPHFALDGAHEVLGAELPALLGEYDLERDVKHHVPEFLANPPPLAETDGVVELHRLLDEVRSEGGRGLGGIPRTPTPKVAHQGDDAPKR
jgi:hypothetical protein